MTIGKSAKAYSEIQNALKGLIDGTVIAIDPSIGSTSSQPGYAIAVAGDLMEAGIIQIDPTLSKPERLKRLVYGVRKLYKEWSPDVLVWEDVPALRQGGGNAAAHASLHNAIGAILSVGGPDHFVGLHPMSWKKLVRSTYVKGDQEDAEEMLWIARQEAIRISAEDPPDRKYGGERAKTRASKARSK